MTDVFSKTIFLDSQPNVVTNRNLRDPQRFAYSALCDHFLVNQSDEDALIVLPTGVGKTGLIAIAPYMISKGRVLIIAPRIPIKDELLKNLSPWSPDNFYLKRKVFTTFKELPFVSEYTKDLPQEVLDKSNIIILNIHKLQERLDSSLINRVSPDYFDMIIIDEAHHSTAETWKKTTDYFKSAKVIKVTGTPFRSDGEKITGKLVYHYSLGRAMAEKYIKSLENVVHIPDKLLLTIDGNEERKYTVEEIYSMGLKDSDWVSRTVAYSKECSKVIVDKSIKLLKMKKNISGLPHKIIAVACSIKHAEQIKELYDQENIRTTIIHSDLSDSQLDKAYSDIENHRVDVVIHVSMLGEGYDHSYLSIAAIFRPFRSELPYVQFVGRILRLIDDENAQPADNIGHIIVHDNLGLDDLWDKYKKEIKRSDIIKKLLQDEKFNNLSTMEPTDERNPYVIDYGAAIEVGDGSSISDYYMETDLIKQVKEQQQEDEEKVQILMKTLNIPRNQAQNMVRISKVKMEDVRPDQTFRNTKTGLDQYIRYELVPEILLKYNLDKSGYELESLPLFSHPYYCWILNPRKDNAAYLAIAFNTYLKNEIGKPRQEWSIDEYKLAYKKLDSMVEYIESMLNREGEE